MISKKTSTPKTVGTNLPATTSSARAKPTPRLASERPIELDGADLISIPPPGRAAEGLDIDIDFDFASPVRPAQGAPPANQMNLLLPDASTTSWENLELFGPTRKVLAAPQLGDIGGAAQASSRPWTAVAANVVQIAQAHRVWLAAVGVAALGVAAVSALVPLVRARAAHAPDTASLARGALDVGTASKHAEQAAAVDAASAVESDARPASNPRHKNSKGAPAPREDTTDRSRTTRPSAPPRANPAAVEDKGSASRAGQASRADSDAREVGPLPQRPSSGGAEPPPLAAQRAERSAPSPSPAFPDIEMAGEFDRNAAMQALRQAGDTSRSCFSGGGADGGARVAVTFGRSGAVSDVAVDAPLSGTPVGSCVASKFRSLHVPPFRGSSVTVRKTITF